MLKSVKQKLGVRRNQSRAKDDGSKNSGMSTSAKPILPVLNETNAYFAFSEPLPGFRDVPSNERQILFVKKLHLASFTFDFNDATKSVREKEIKRQTLLELVDYVNTGQGKFGEAIYEDIVFMLSHNLFRTLPPGRSSIENEMFDPEEEEPTLEPAWPHLQIVYEFLLRYIVSEDTEAKIAK